MVRDLRVHLLPALFEPEDVRGGIAVILDILRASTVIVHALANGAEAIVPCLTIDAAREAAHALATGGQRALTSTDASGACATPSVLLGGEREGVAIPGFDLDNNPFAYAEDVVRGKTIVFTTTNGTKALHRSVLAERVFIGAFVNLQAVVDVLASERRPIHLVCAGTRDKVSGEDVLAAGAIIDRLLEEFGNRDGDLVDDQAQIALSHFLNANLCDDMFRQSMRNSYGGRNCRRLGFDAQIDRASTFDLFDLVPEYHHATGRIERVKKGE